MIPYIDAQRITLTTTRTRFALRSAGEAVELEIVRVWLEVPDGFVVVDPHLEIEGLRVAGFPVLVGLAPNYGDRDGALPEGGLRVPAGSRVAVSAALSAGTTTGLIRAQGSGR